MTAVAIERPATDEYESAFGRYISRVPDLDDAVAALAVQQDRVARTIAPLTDSEAAHRYAPGKWSIKELLGHVCDAERIFAYRLLRVARGDVTPLPGFEENDYVVTARSDQRRVSDLIDEWRAVRSATITLVGATPAEAWPRRGTSNNQPITARALLYIILGHADHHLDVLNTRYGVPRL